MRFGLPALQRYADGHGYEQELTDVLKCHEMVCLAAIHAKRRDEVAEKGRVLAENETSKGRLVAAAVKYGREVMKNVVAFRPRG